MSKKLEKTVEKFLDRGQSAQKRLKKLYGVTEMGAESDLDKFFARYSEDVFQVWHV